MDSKDKTRCFISIATLATVSLVAGESKVDLTKFDCSSVDVCNAYGKPQFCEDERCLNCEDYTFRCGTSQMSTTCSEFCWELKTNETLGRTCSPPWKIPNGHVEVSPAIYGRHLAGTILTFVCDEGFELRPNNNFTCNDTGQWSPESTTPFCIQVSTSSQCVESIPLAVGITVSIVIFFAVGCTVYICLRRQCMEINTNRALTSMGTADEIDPLTEEPVSGQPCGTNDDNSNTNNADFNTDSNVVDMNMEEIGTPTQEVDEQTNLVCEESVESNTIRKLALGDNTIDKSDIASNYRV